MLSIQIGGVDEDFIDNYGIKGCHVKNGKAFYGTGALAKIEHQKSLLKPNYRPNGYDCGTIFIYTCRFLKKYSLMLKIQKP